MKTTKLLILGLIHFVMMNGAYAAPNCNQGDTCMGYMWSTKSGTFICQGSCSCRNTTYTCITPCEEMLCISGGRNCTTLGGYKTCITTTCTDDFITGMCNQGNTTAYECASGYYGTATSATAGCTACPDNATCAGGNGSTFVCNTGYYKNGSTCTACGGNSTTSGTGATSQSDCYIPSGSAFSDSTGSGSYTDDCYY